MGDDNFDPSAERTLRFECTQCGDCCRQRGEYAHVYVDRGEVRSLAAATGMSVERFVDRHTFVDEYGWRQIRFENERCPFLSDEHNRCSVYDARPTQCRTFPFWPEFIVAGRFTFEASQICEGVGQGDPLPEHVPARALAEMEAWDERAATEEDGFEEV